MTGSYLNFADRHEHRCKKLSEYLALWFGDDAARLGLIPVRHEAADTFALGIAVRLGNDARGFGIC